MMRETFKVTDNRKPKNVGKETDEIWPDGDAKITSDKRPSI